MIENVTISPHAVRAQLGQILASEAFVRCPRMQRFLRFIIEETLAGRADQLGEYAIGVAVFDRGTDFEPAVDPIVRNDARRLRLKLAEYYRQQFSDSADLVVIEIPKGGYVPIFLAVTPGSARETVSAQRLAVLPFEMLSGTANGMVNGRALCMSLTASLTNLDGLETVAHGLVREQTMRECASELRLSHVIHGSVLDWSDRCRVVVNLIRLQTGTQIWAREYDFAIGETMEAQAEIAASVKREVARKLGLGSVPEPRPSGSGIHRVDRLTRAA
jgi:TolB-like protein